MNWSSIRDQWSESWHDLLDRALDKHEDAIVASPSRYTQLTGAFLDTLRRLRASLERYQAVIRSGELAPEDQARAAARYGVLAAKYQALAAGMYAEAKPANDKVGEPLTVVAVVLVVGGLALGVGAVAWAVAAYNYASALDARYQVEAAELEARAKLNAQGRQLQSTTLQEAKTAEANALQATAEADQAEAESKGVGFKMGALILGGLGLAATGLTIYAFMQGGGEG